MAIEYSFQPMLGRVEFLEMALGTPTDLRPPNSPDLVLSLSAFSARVSVSSDVHWIVRYPDPKIKRAVNF